MSGCGLGVGILGGGVGVVGVVMVVVMEEAVHEVLFVGGVGLVCSHYSVSMRSLRREIAWRREGRGRACVP